MHRWLALFLLSWVPAFPSLVIAADLEATRVPVPRLPATLAAPPKYCRLVFGPQADTRIWLIWDGTALFMDRKGDGDLSRPECRITGKKRTEDDPDQDGPVIFDLGDIRDRNRVHKEVTVWIQKLKSLASLEGAGALLARDPSASAYSLSAAIEVPGFRGNGPDGRLRQCAGPSDLNGILQFADRPEEAPVLHFGGPWTICLQQKVTLRPLRDAQLFACLATPGLGPGSRVHTGYENLVPDQLYSRAEITFPAAKPGSPPVKAVYELKGRC